MFAGRGDKRRRRGGRGERSVLPEGTKRQRVARRQDASESDGADAGIYDGMGDCREARREMRKRSP